MATPIPPLTDSQSAIYETCGFPKFWNQEPNKVVLKTYYILIKGVASGIFPLEEAISILSWIIKNRLHDPKAMNQIMAMMRQPDEQVETPIKENWGSSKFHKAQRALMLGIPEFPMSISGGRDYRIGKGIYSDGGTFTENIQGETGLPGFQVVWELVVATHKGMYTVQEAAAALDLILRRNPGNRLLHEEMDWAFNGHGIDQGNEKLLDVLRDIENHSKLLKILRPENKPKPVRPWDQSAKSPTELSKPSKRHYSSLETILSLQPMTGEVKNYQFQAVKNRFVPRDPDLVKSFQGLCAEVRKGNMTAKNAASALDNIVHHRNYGEVYKGINYHDKIEPLQPGDAVASVQILNCAQVAAYDLNLYTGILNWVGGLDFTNAYTKDSAPNKNGDMFSDSLLDVAILSSESDYGLLESVQNICRDFTSGLITHVEAATILDCHMQKILEFSAELHEPGEIPPPVLCKTLTNNGSCSYKLKDLAKTYVILKACSSTLNSWLEPIDKIKDWVGSTYINNARRDLIDEITWRGPGSDQCMYLHKGEPRLDWGKMLLKDCIYDPKKNPEVSLKVSTLKNLVVGIASSKISLQNALGFWKQAVKEKFTTQASVYKLEYRTMCDDNGWVNLNPIDVAVAWWGFAMAANLPFEESLPDEMSKWLGPNVLETGRSIRNAKEHKRSAPVPRRSDTKHEKEDLPTTSKNLDPSLLTVASETLQNDAKEIAIRVGVKKLKTFLADRMSEFWSRRNPESSQSQIVDFFSTDTGQGVLSYLLGATWEMVSPEVSEPKVLEFGDAVARECRISGGSILLDEVLDGIGKPILEELNSIETKSGIRIDPELKPETEDVTVETLCIQGNTGR